MFSFLVGVAVGAGAVWLYQQIREEMPSGERAIERVQRPSEREIHGRPSEPLPAEHPPAPEAEHPMGMGHRG